MFVLPFSCVIVCLFLFFPLCSSTMSELLELLKTQPALMMGRVRHRDAKAAANCVVKTKSMLEGQCLSAFP